MNSPLSVLLFAQALHLLLVLADPFNITVVEAGLVDLLRQSVITNFREVGEAGKRIVS